MFFFALQSTINGEFEQANCYANQTKVNEESIALGYALKEIAERSKISFRLEEKYI